MTRHDLPLAGRPMIGRVIHPSGLDAILGNDLTATSWLIGAYTASSPLYVPALALSEVRSLRRTLLADLDELLGHPCIVRRDLDNAAGADVGALFQRTGTFDVCAGHVVVVARERGWPVITGDPGRLRRIDPDVDVVLV